MYDDGMTTWEETTVGNKKKTGELLTDLGMRQTKNTPILVGTDFVLGASQSHVLRRMAVYEDEDAH